jgi:TorA maturation chaperone TorD
VPDEDTPVELLRGLAVLAEPPGPEHRTLTTALELGGVPSATEYSDVFLFQLYPYASVYLGGEGMMGGEAADRIAGFWRALGLEPPTESDHLAALIGLYATLAEGESALEGAERILSRRSRAALLHEHLAPWVFAYLDRIMEIAPPAYRRWAELLAQALRVSLTALGPLLPQELPVHLRHATPLPDPRADGPDDFLSGLLAPARTGMIITRFDLARVAAEADVGLRAGERRYALQHVLAQRAEPVLLLLANEARRQEAGHRGRVEWLGETASWWADRAVATATLLESLSEDGSLGATTPAASSALDDAGP